MMVKEYGKTIGARLSDDEIASLNQLLRQDNYSNSGDLIRSILNGDFKGNEATHLHEIVNKLEGIVNKLTKMVGPAGFEPATYGSLQLQTAHHPFGQ